MSSHDVIKFAARSRIPWSDAEIAAETSLDPDDGWFMPALFVGFMLILFGSAYLAGS
ncbi:MAG: hypothetical protein ABJA75_12330 [Bradyrhizobium sp.]